MTERASFDEVLDFCNKVRDAGGANPLDALMPAIPQKQEACLIALNLNFSCTVSPRYGSSCVEFNKHIEQLGYDANTDDPIWTMNVGDEKVARRIAQTLDLPVYDLRKSGAVGSSVYNSHPWAVGLPKSIAAVARDFDEWVENPEEYLDFEPYVKDSVKTRMDELFDSGEAYNPETIV